MLQRVFLAFFAASVQLSFASAAEPTRPYVVGHRGLLTHAPENTLAAFRACLSLRVGFEFDVRRTKDGELVCLHDATLERTTDAQGKLADKTFAEVRKLDAGSWFDRAFARERVPSVAEIMALLAEHDVDALIAVDMKDTGGEIEETVVRLAEKHKVLERLMFIGATIESSEVRSRLIAASPKAKVARLASKPEEIAAAIKDEQCSWVYVRFLPESSAIERIHSAGKRIFLAGPLVAGELPENWAKAAALKFDGVLTDYPLEMQKLLRAKP